MTIIKNCYIKAQDRRLSMTNIKFHTINAFELLNMEALENTGIKIEPLQSKKFKLIDELLNPRRLRFFGKGGGMFQLYACKHDYPHSIEAFSIK